VAVAAMLRDLRRFRLGSVPLRSVSKLASLCAALARLALGNASAFASPPTSHTQEIDLVTGELQPQTEFVYWLTIQNEHGVTHFPDGNFTCAQVDGVRIHDELGLF
jgi:hypothetical protein